MQPLGLLALAALAFAVLGATAAAVCRRLGWNDVSFAHGSILTTQTSVLNRHFVRWGRQHKRPLQAFFNLAPPVAAVLAAAAACLLVREAWVALRFWLQLLDGWLLEDADGFGSAKQAVHGSSQLALAVPGLTIPWAHAGFLWVAAALSICVHESGHALAAAAEGVTLHHVALFLVLWVPGASVALDSEGLAALTPWRVLRVVCAGVWHNGLLCLVCWLSALLLPVLLLPLYSTGQGAVIWSVPQQSALHSHLQPGDTITDLNGCAVRSADSLRACIFAQDVAQQHQLAVAQRPLRAAKVLTGERLMRSKAGQQSGAAADPLLPDDLLSDLAAGGTEPQSGTVPAAVPLLATPQRGYCVSDRATEAAEACLLDMRQLRGSACAPYELCFAGAHHDFGAASLQGAMELLTADADVERHVLRAAPETELGGQVTGVCLRARTVAAGASCNSQTAPCPEGSKCLAPLLHYGADMFKVTYLPGPWHAPAAISPATQSAVTAGRQLRARQQPEQHRKAHKQRQKEATGSTRGHGAATVASVQKAVLKVTRPADHAWRGDLSGQPRPWVVEDSAAAGPARSAEQQSAAAAVDPMPAAMPESAAAMRTTQQQQQQQPVEQEDTQQWQQPFIVWVGMAAEAASAFETSSYSPRQGLAPLWLPAALERLAGFTFAVSAAVAVLNMLPLAVLDGGQALQAALAMNRWELGPVVVAGLDMSKRNMVRTWSIRICTALVVFVAASHVLRLLL